MYATCVRSGETRRVSGLRQGPDLWMGQVSCEGGMGPCSQLDHSLTEVQVTCIEQSQTGTERG